MKLFVISFLTIFILQSSNWRQKVQDQIKMIDKDSILIKEVRKSDSIDTALIQFYTYKSFSKVQMYGSNKVGLTFYKEGNFIFASRTIINLPRFSKGVQPINKKGFYVHEYKTYFKNKKEGLEYSRAIPGSHNDNRDSLIVELQNLKYDSSIIDNQDYRNTYKLYKSFLKVLK